ncbi:MAG: hypothetical protein ACI4EE_07745 [Lachnospiraceae bacterium]
MKKSFMTRVLATGLSLAMAFSLTAATNVSVASAAAKPAMKSTKMTVKVGQSKNYQATAATQKAYKITGIKMSAAGKTKASVTINSSKKSIKVTGLAATKSSNVIITFKNNKTKKTTKVTTKVVVKEVVTKQSIVSAEVTGAKTITLTMAKDVASVESPVAITLKKGTNTKEQKATADGKTIKIVTDTKLTAGDYAISIKGLETEELTATVNVAKNETLTTYEIGKELIAKSRTETTTGYIYYKALNQYGEMMTANAPSPTVSFSNEAKVIKTATADEEGKIEVTNINTALAIIGTKGTAVLVDSTLGVNNTGEVTYTSNATASKVEIVGVYDTVHSKFSDLIAHTNAANYYLLMSFEDQFGHKMNSKDDIQTSVIDNGINVAGGITKVEKNDVKEFTVDGKAYIALTFKQQTMQAGEITLTIVNNEKGLLATEKLVVVDDVILASFTANADNGVYNKQENEMSYEAVDTNGNTVTDYATLSRLVDLKNAPNMRFVRQKDGSAKLIYEPNASITSNKTQTAYTTESKTFMLNDTTSTNYKVATQLYTVNEERFIKRGYGLKAGTSTQVAVGRTLDIGYDKFVYEDQYANKVADGDHNYTKTVTTQGAANPVSSASVYVVSDAGMTVTFASGKMSFKANSPSAVATVYVKYHTSIQTDAAFKAEAATDAYDFKFTVNAVSTDQADVAGVKLVSIFDGYEEQVGQGSAKSESAIKASDINVTVVQGGVETRIPDQQITIDKISDASITADDLAKNPKVESKTAKVEFTVTTFDNNNNPTYTKMSGTWTVSVKASKVYKLRGTADLDVNLSAAPDKIVTAGSLVTAFTFKDQYGKDMTGVTATTNGAADVKYSAVVLNSTDVKVYSHDSNNIKIDCNGVAAGTKVSVEITATSPDGTSKTKKITIQC